MAYNTYVRAAVPHVIHTHAQSLLMLSVISVLPHDKHLSLALGQGALFIILYLYKKPLRPFCASRTPGTGVQESPRAKCLLLASEKQKSRLLILALPLFWSGCACTEKWLLPSPCPCCHPAEPRCGAGGRRTEGCTQVSQGHAGGLF